MFGIFKRKSNSRKNKLIDRIKGESSNSQEFAVDLNEGFEEKAPSIFAQFKKLSKSFLDNVENIRTNIYPNEIFVVEVLDESVSIAIVGRRWLFLDIKYLKKYTFYELHESYQRIIDKEVPYDREWYESLENIITIVSYETLYSLPKKMVIIDNRYSDFIKVTTKKGRFKDKEILKNLIKKELEMATGFKEEQIYKQVAQRPSEKNSDKTIYVISVAEKEYYDKLSSYLQDSEFTIKRYHSIKSSLYSSFFTHQYEAVMRVHVVGSIAYTMQKHKESGFEYQQFNLEIDFTGIELVSYSMDEVIVSGSGEYYEKLKKIFIDSNVKVRTFNYNRDLNRCLIRLEKGVHLDNSFATTVSSAYHELFKINFSSIRLGITRHLSLYEIMYNNLNILPFIFLFFIVLFIGGVYGYLEYQYKTINLKHKDTTKLISEKNSLENSLKSSQAKVRSIKTRLDNINKIFEQTKESFDAIVLHEIAQKLPDDLIITDIEKKLVSQNKNQSSFLIQIKGKCYQERSLLQFINSLDFKDKEVYLISLQDSKKTKFEDPKESSYYENLIQQQLQAQQPNTGDKPEQNTQGIEQEKLQEILKMNLEDKKVYFSDTLNNSFVLEIR